MRLSDEIVFNLQGMLQNKMVVITLQKDIRSQDEIANDDPIVSAGIIAAKIVKISIGRLTNSTMNISRIT